MMTNKGKWYWQDVAGHVLTVGEFKFSVCCLPGYLINVSELETGAKAFDLFDISPLETQEEAFDFYKDNIGSILINILEKYPNFNEIVQKQKKKLNKILSNKPQVTDIDERLIISNKINLIH